MKRFKRTMWLLLLCMVLVYALAGCKSKHAESTGGTRENSSMKMITDDITKTTDVVLVLDESGSMIHADPDRIAIEGAKKFVDMITLGTNLGLVEFSNKVNAIDLLDMTDWQNRENIKTFLDGIVYDPPAHTDTGWGLKKAEEILAGAPEEDRKIILLFTDGKTDIDVGTPGRTTEDSKQDVDEAISEAQARGYEIYCIGLNADGNVDEGELSKIALSTSASYRIANSVEELPDFYTSIIGEIGGSRQINNDEYEADGEYHAVPFTVDSSSVMEVTVNIQSGSPIEDIQITAPSGELGIQDHPDQVHYTVSGTYSTLKLFYPEAGEWTVNVKGVQGAQIKIDMIYNYDVDLSVDMFRTKLEKGEEEDIHVQLSSRENMITDEALYQGLTGFVSATNKDTNETTRIELKNINTSLYGTFQANEYGTYACTVHIEGNGFFRDSQEFEIIVTEDAPQAVKKLDTLRVRKGKSIKKDLDKYFADPKGNKLTYHVECNNERCSAAITEDHILEITGVETGISYVLVSANNDSDITMTQQITVKVETMGAVLLRNVVPVLFILLLLLVIWSRTKGRETVSGVLDDISIEYTGPDPETGTSRSERYRIPCNMELRSLGKRGATADKLLRILKSYYGSYGTESQKEAFIRAVDTFKEEASHVRISGSKQPYTIKLTKTGNHVRLLPLDGEKQTVSLNEGSGYTPVMKHEQRIGFQFDKYGKEDTTVPEETLVISMNYKRM